MAVDAYTVTGGRILGTAAVLVALAGLIVAVVTLVRRGGVRPAAVALVAGLVGAAAGAVVLAVADGGPGTGNGVVGGFAAVVAGLAGAALGGTALVRSRRA